MNTIDIQIELESDVVVSRSSATFGGHKSLDYLPGATLRGAFASFLSRFEPSLLDAALFSGKLRFGPAYPVAVDGATAIPVPRSWHHIKGKALETTRDLSAGSADAGEQFVQLRDGYVSGAALLKVQMVFSMRTATDRKGRASEGLLFGYQAIRAGQRFLARIDADDPVLYERVERWISAGKAQLGRSRSAEFGAVTLSKVAPKPVDALLREGPNDGMLSGYCYSDLLLRDPDTGAPTVTPSPTHFGLKNCEFDPARSYLRTRAYSPFNGERRRPDLERQVIEAGSVIVFKNVAPGDARAASTQVGIVFGEAVEEGLGRVVWNPTFLTPPAGLAQAERSAKGSRSTTEPTATPKGVLGDYVDGLLLEAQRDAEIGAIVTRLGNTLREFRIPPSQWGVLRDIGRGGGDFAQLCAALYEQISKDKGVSAQLIWTRRIGTTSAAKVLEEGIEALPKHLQRDAGVMIERLAARMLRENRGVDRV